MLVKIEVGGAEAVSVAIFEAESVQAAANKARDAWKLPEGHEVRWVPKEGNYCFDWPTTAYYLYFEPGFHDTVEEAALDDEHATWICAREIQLGEYWDPDLD